MSLRTMATQSWNADRTPRFFCSPAEAKSSDSQVFSLQFAPLFCKNRGQTDLDPVWKVQQVETNCKGNNNW
jgi:hypothetical protein